MATIKILKQPTKEFKANSARASYWKAIQAFKEQVLDNFVEACAKKPPHLNKHGVAESVRGWVTFFKSQGLVEVS